MECIKILKNKQKDYNIKTFSIHEKKRDMAILLKKFILDHKHFENMLNILIKECWDKKDYEIAYLLRNKVILKAVSQKLNGGRGVDKKRGLFKDKKLNKIINSDLNGAANHVKLGFPEVVLTIFRNHLHKVCNPKTIKIVSEFDKFLSNNEAEKKTTLQKVA